MPSADTIKPRALPRGHDSADADAVHQGLMELKHHLAEAKSKMNGAANGHPSHSNGKARQRDDDDEGMNGVESPAVVNGGVTSVAGDSANGNGSNARGEEALLANQSGPKASHPQDLDLDPDPVCVAAVAAASAAVALNGPADPSGPFEGPEKLLELWFAPSPEALPEDAPDGLRSISRDEWDDMLDIVKCKVLSTLHKGECDAYLLSESSMFVFPHKMILKTCGTTTLLLGLERILHLAWKALYPKRASTSSDHTPRQLGRIVQRCFYSRKTFMFPERQQGPHRDWTRETEVLDSFLDNGSAYTVGKMNGDHWLLYSSASAEADKNLSSSPMRSIRSQPQDQTLEILMTHLSPESCERFYFPDAEGDDAAEGGLDKGHRLGFELSDRIGLSTLFPATKLDAFGFEPCGYSANALMGPEMPTSAAAAAAAAAAGSASREGETAAAGRGEGPAYWTVHVTPEEGSSYASFETNINVADLASGVSADDANAVKDLPSLVRRIVDIFQPGRLSVTLFTSTTGIDGDGDGDGDGDEGAEVKGESGQSQQDQQGDVLHALQLPGYRRTDRIAYEFEDYDLVFVSLDRVG